MKKISIIPATCCINENDFCNEASKLFRKHGLEKQMIPFIIAVKEATADKKGKFVTHENQDFELNQDLENLFFKTLLGAVPDNTYIYKYTSWNNLSRICSDNTIAMASVLGMNDSSEYFYANEFLKQHGVESPLELSDHYLIGANTFITSFSLLKDDLTMWRLYGNDANGISLGFKVADSLPDGFFLAPISYAEKDKSHPKLELVAEMQKMQISNLRFRFERFYLWQNFFKPYDYKIEKEIRLLYTESKALSGLNWSKNKEGMITGVKLFEIDYCDKKYPLYPLELKKIILGPEFDRKQENEEILKIMLKSSRGWTEEQVEVISSEINNYRSSK